MNVLLISEDYVRTNSNLNDNVFGKWILPAIREAQEMGLMPIIGECLYKRICEMVDNGDIDKKVYAAYKDLLDEKIQPYLLYQTLTNIVPLLNGKMGNIGTVATNDEHIVTLSQGELDLTQNYYRERADFYAKRLQEWVKANDLAFPELNCGCGNMKPNLERSNNSVGMWLGGARGKKVRSNDCGCKTDAVRPDCPPCRDYDEGYQSGYTSGHTDGYGEGYEDGYDKGQEDCPVCPDCDDAYQSGYTSGHTDGYGEGYDDGYDKGETDGFGEGFESGYTSGHTDGVEVVTTDFRHIDITQNGDYYKVGNYGAYSSITVDVATGSSCNLGELSIHLDTAQDWEAGVTFDEPVGDGWSSVTITDSEYGEAQYQSGYTSGHTDGYASGWTSGFSSGYTSGYTDGVGAGAVLQERSVTMTAETETVLPESGFVGMSAVSIDASTIIGNAYDSGYTDGVDSIHIQDVKNDTPTYTEGEPYTVSPDFEYDSMASVELDLSDVYGQGYSDGEENTLISVMDSAQELTATTNGVWTANTDTGLFSSVTVNVSGSSCALQAKSVEMSATTQTFYPDSPTITRLLGFEEPAWGSLNMIDTGVYPTQTMRVRIKYRGRGVLSDRIIGTIEGVGETTDSDDWRFFDAIEHRCYDIGENRYDDYDGAFTDDETDYDITMASNGLYNHIDDEFYFEGMEEELPEGDTICVDIGTIWVQEVIITDEGVEVFHGVPMVSGNTAGLYDTVTDEFFAPDSGATDTAIIETEESSDPAYDGMSAVTVDASAICQNYYDSGYTSGYTDGENGIVSGIGVYQTNDKSLYDATFQKYTTNGENYLYENAIFSNLYVGNYGYYTFNTINTPIKFGAYGTGFYPDRELSRGSKLTFMQLPDSIERVDFSCFAYTDHVASNLKKVVLPQSLDAITGDAFDNCPVLTEIVATSLTGPQTVQQPILGKANLPPFGTMYVPSGYSGYSNFITFLPDGWLVSTNTPPLCEQRYIDEMIVVADVDWPNGTYDLYNSTADTTNLTEIKVDGVVVSGQTYSGSVGKITYRFSNGIPNYFFKDMDFGYNQQTSASTVEVFLYRSQGYIGNGAFENVSGLDTLRIFTEYDNSVLTVKTDAVKNTDIRVFGVYAVATASSSAASTNLVIEQNAVCNNSSLYQVSVYANVNESSFLANSRSTGSIATSDDNITDRSWYSNISGWTVSLK